VVAEFWSEIAQDNDDQDEEWLYVQERKNSNLNEKFFGCSFPLGSRRSNQRWSFPFVRG
jgi:hypothetical protein